MLLIHRGGLLVWLSGRRPRETRRIFRRTISRGMASLQLVATQRFCVLELVAGSLAVPSSTAGPAAVGAGVTAAAAAAAAAEASAAWSKRGRSREGVVELFLEDDYSRHCLAAGPCPCSHSSSALSLPSYVFPYFLASCLDVCSNSRSHSLAIALCARGQLFVGVQAGGASRSGQCRRTRLRRRLVATARV